MDMSGLHIFIDKKLTKIFYIIWKLGKGTIELYRLKITYEIIDKMT